VKPRDWRLWRILRGAFRPGPGPFDMEEAQRRRAEAEAELACARARWPAVEAASRIGAMPAAHPDELAFLIERAFQRRAT
jgi:hypothetical protein